MGAASLPTGFRTPILAGVGAAISLAALYVAHLFYLQFIVAVSGVAAIACIVALDRPPEPSVESGPGSLAEDWARAKTDLERLDARLSKTDDERETQFLRRQRSSLLHELRRLEWRFRERDMESAGALTTGALAPLAARPGRLKKRARAKEESRHLIEALEEAADVLALDPPTSARVSLALIANDIRANHDLLKRTPESASLDDYGAAWAVLTSLTTGIDPGGVAYRHASSKVRRILDMLVGLAGSK
jgi:hypothetical protein